MNTAGRNAAWLRRRLRFWSCTVAPARGEAVATGARMPSFAERWGWRSTPAGVGSALAADAGVWCDATLMSAEGYAGAVAAVQGIRHPILAAQALAHAEAGPLLWAGRSTELAALHDLELIDPELM